MTVKELKTSWVGSAITDLCGWRVVVAGTAGIEQLRARAANMHLGAGLRSNQRGVGAKKEKGRLKPYLCGGWVRD